MADKKKKEPSLWERAKKRASEEIDMLKNKPSAFASADGAEAQKRYEKKKRKSD